MVYFGGFFCVSSALKIMHSSAASSVHQRYQQFLITLVQQQQVMALLSSSQRWAWSVTPTGQQALALWQHPRLLQPMLEHWPGYCIYPIALADLIDKVLPVLQREHKYLILNMSADGEQILRTPQQFLLDLKHYLYALQSQDPSAFQRLGLPEPRKIRLHKKTEP